MVARDGRRQVEAGASAELALLRERLEKVVGRVCPRWLASQADDLVQTAMLRLLDVLARRVHSRSFSSSYLYKVAYSALVDEIRLLRRRREVAIEDDEGMEMPIESPVTGPEERASGRRLGDEIADCLKRLIVPRRRAVALHLYGHTGAEASKLLGHRLKQVRNLTYRGLADLRGCLQTKGLEP
jgi:RNA polymerase sigma-70 factor (ECF subfamily)